MNKKEKNELIDVLNNMLDENKNFYLADIAGLTAEESSSLRRLCFKQNVTIQVVKNTLLKKALDKNSTDFTQLDDILKGNTSLMFAEEAKAIHYGEAEERGIYGEATNQEAVELFEEDIPVYKVPWNQRRDS